MADHDDVNFGRSLDISSLKLFGHAIDIKLLEADIILENVLTITQFILSLNVIRPILTKKL